MKNVETIVLTIAMFVKMTVHETNKRSMRFVKAIASSMRAVGYSCKKDELTGTVDLPIVTGSVQRGLAIVRGCGRLGTIALGLESEDEKVKAFFVELVETGKVTALLVKGKIDMLRKIASDNDSLKENWNRAQAYAQYLDLVHIDGLSSKEASIIVGYTNRMQIFETMQRAPKELVLAWIASQNDEPDAVNISDPMVTKATKFSDDYKEDNPATKASDIGDEARDYVAKCLAGTTEPVAKMTATVAQLKKLSATIRDYPADLSPDMVGDMLLVLAGYKKDGKPFAAPKDKFTAHVNRIMGAAVK